MLIVVVCALFFLGGVLTLQFYDTLFRSEFKDESGFDVFYAFFVAAGESHWMRIIGSNIGIKERFSRRAKVIWKKGNDSAHGIAVAVRVS